MGEFSNLEDVWLDFLWLDDTLCDALASAGRRLKRLRLGTSGTKLTDKGVLSIMERCDSLEEFSLLEVQGTSHHVLRRGSKHSSPPDDCKVACRVIYGARFQIYR